MGRVSDTLESAETVISETSFLPGRKPMFPIKIFLSAGLARPAGGTINFVTILYMGGTSQDVEGLKHGIFNLYILGFLDISHFLL